jgi:hypothetical protein
MVIATPSTVETLWVSIFQLQIARLEMRIYVLMIASFLVGLRLQREKPFTFMTRATGAPESEHT